MGGLYVSAGFLVVLLEGRNRAENDRPSPDIMSLKVLSTTLRTAASPAVAGRALASTSTATYSERQAALGRPISPHVTIYKMPITAVSSVMNRFTAMGITAGLSAGSALALVGADVPAIIYTCQDVIPGFAPISKFFVAYPIAYHMLAAARHAVRCSCLLLALPPSLGEY